MPTPTITRVFDIDQHTGFMASEPSLDRLPHCWEAWETVLDDAIESKLQVGDKLGLTDEQRAISKRWRDRVRALPALSVFGLLSSAVLLRRSHLVLTFILHFYVQSIPPTDPVSIPRSITLPLLRISKELDIPPILTYSDTVLYNWSFKSKPKPESRSVVPELDNIRSTTTFTGLVDEEEFLLCSGRIELRAVEILGMMQVTMDEVFLGDATAVRRVTEHLNIITSALSELRSLFFNVKKLCDPDIYYNEVRPWFRGEDSSDTKRKWIFEGIDEDPELRPPTELSGPSAGQSSIIHAIDIFIGVDHQAISPGQPSFMSRMQTYMPKNHRLFLSHIKTNPRPLRTFVMDRNDEALMKAYNLAVIALKEFRDAHMVIASLYILGPARRATKRKLEAAKADVNRLNPTPRAQPPKGTGGTNLVKFLKDTRDQTMKTIID